MGAVRTSVTIAILVVAAAGCEQRETIEPQPALRVRLLASDTLDEPWRTQGDFVLERLRVEFGAEATRVSVDDSDSRRAALRAAGEDEVGLVVCVGAAFEREVFTVAQRYPLTAFLLSPGSVTAANVAVLEFQPFGAAYIGGVVAASEGGRQVAVISGEGGAWLEAIAAGFVEGFRGRFPSGQIDNCILPEDVANLPEASVAVALYAADRLDPALVAVVRQAGIRLISVGRGAMREYPETVIAAVSVDLPEAVDRIARDVMDGTFRGRVYTFDLGSGVVDLAISPGLQAGWDEDDLGRVDEARAAVNAGLVELERMGL